MEEVDEKMNSFGRAGSGESDLTVSVLPFLELGEGLLAER